MKWKPVALPQAKSWHEMSAGLGFDHVNGDFKIIWVGPVGKSESSRVEIYSVKEESWYVGDEITNFSPSSFQCNFVLRGAPYWTGRDGKRDKNLGGFDVLARIDPCTGSCSRFRYPDHGKDYVVSIVKLRDVVAALVPSSVQNNVLNLYHLDENSGSWTLMNCVGPLDNRITYAPQCLSTGEIVLVTWKHGLGEVTYFWDPDTNRLLCNREIEDLEVCWYRAYSHVESLVCIEGMVQIGKEHREDTGQLKTRTFLNFRLHEAMLLFPTSHAKGPPSEVQPDIMNTDLLSREAESIHLL
ncbi:hypothetical protein POM88_033604 [Heracleum sosnowskyi]|uniref:F-box associated beta-propeller type 1 domain-containing protein n=1 Tax=Heracleum sosnowskyi TaxID=360622 RepID=A0AAD8HJT6_9APIA|nr:hypothetical protein POM88_033604 [Heracleum sosnowskyi]